MTNKLVFIKPQTLFIKISNNTSQAKHSMLRKLLLNFKSYNSSKTRNSHQEAQPAWENNSFGFIEAAWVVIKEATSLKPHKIPLCL